MNDAFGNPLMIEVEYLFAKMKIVDQSGPAGAHAKRILVVGHRAALGGCQNVVAVVGELMKLAAPASVKLLIVDCRRVSGRI
jgi:hypothetical protein